MNEKEEQAIHYFKNKIGDFELIYGKKITTKENEYLKILLVLVESQQEQIEELRECCNKYNDMKYFAMAGDRYISKDKIREKIEEYKKKCDECNFNKSGICKELKAYNCCSIQSVLELLKELIGETK